MKVRVPGDDAVTMPKSSLLSLTARGGEDDAGREGKEIACVEAFVAERVTIPGPEPVSNAAHCLPGARVGWHVEVTP